MKRITDPITGKKLRWHTFEAVIKKASRSKEFRKAYQERLARHRLASAIRDSREAMNMTQASVARKANMPQSVIARLESGTHSVSVDTLSKVAHALGKQIQLV